MSDDGTCGQLGDDKFYLHGDLINDRVLDRGTLTVSVEISLAWEELASDVKELKQEVVNLKNMMRTMDTFLTSKFKALESSMKSSLPCPECPICFEEMKPPTRIVQCRSGHLICQQCRDVKEVISCPTCAQEFTGRAFGMESHLRALFCCAEQ
eukprot:GFUD01054353.1.p1 GENE.GFUD01054353.1~~GFUD01054353.1.p1  ORF type:complete len:153 (+),score=32.94 GFUD01054353.1:363-821(+)